jgi:hypothetical protein
MSEADYDVVADRTVGWLLDDDRLRTNRLADRGLGEGGLDEVRTPLSPTGPFLPSAAAIVQEWFSGPAAGSSFVSRPIPSSRDDSLGQLPVSDRRAVEAQVRRRDAKSSPLPRR